MDSCERKALLGTVILDVIYLVVVITFQIPSPFGAGFFFSMFAYIGFLAFFARNATTYTNRNKKL